VYFDGIEPLLANAADRRTNTKGIIETTPHRGNCALVPTVFSIADHA